MLCVEIAARTEVIHAGAGAQCQLRSATHKLVNGFILLPPPPTHTHYGERGRSSENEEVAVGGTSELPWEPKLRG